jgi:hypothetical protein
LTKGKYNIDMDINKILKEELGKTKSRYVISKATGINEGLLSKFLHNKQSGVSAKTAGKLLEFFGYEITKRSD